MKETDVIRLHGGKNYERRNGSSLRSPLQDLQILPNKYTPTERPIKNEYPLFIDIQFKVKKRSR